MSKTLARTASTVCVLTGCLAIAACGHGAKTRTLHGTLNYWWDYGSAKAAVELYGGKIPKPGCSRASVPVLSINIKDSSGKVLRVVTAPVMHRAPNHSPVYDTHCAADYSVTVPDEDVYILSDDTDPQDTITVNASDLKNGKLPPYIFGE